MAAIALLDSLAVSTSPAPARPAEPPAVTAFGSVLMQAMPDAETMLPECAMAATTAPAAAALDATAPAPAPAAVLTLTPPALPAAVAAAPPVSAPATTSPTARPIPDKPGCSTDTVLPAGVELLLASAAPIPEGVVRRSRPAPAGEPPPSEAATAVAGGSPEAFLRWLDAVKECNEPQLPKYMAAVTTPMLPGSTAITTDEALAAAVTAMPLEVVTAISPVLAESSTAPSATTTPVFIAATAPLPPASQTPAAPLPLVNTPLPMDSPEWPQRLGEQIQWHLGVGIQEARIEVSPRELGLVDVRLSVDDNGLRVHLTAAHAQTRELLQNELPRLREVLQQGGMLLADAQVGREAPGHDSGRQGSSAFAEGKAEDAADDANPLLPTLWRHRKGLLDDYA